MITKEKQAIFWSRVNKDGPQPDQTQPHYAGLGQCWEWDGCISGGYGLFTVIKGGRNIPAHRASWMIHYGPIPKGLFVCHRCDNKKCINPGHLFLGTSKENNQDRHAKGRSGAARGAKNGMTTCPESVRRGDNHPARLKPWTRPRGTKVNTAKLNESQVIEMRARHAAGGVTYAQLAKEYPVSIVMVGLIVRGQSWKHVTLPNKDA